MVLPDVSYSPGGLIGTSVLCFITWYLLTAALSCYRFQGVPGPFLAKFSYLWSGYQSGTGRLHESNRTLCRKYKSSLVRIGPRDLTTDDPDLIRKMNGTKSVWNKAEGYLGNRFNPYHPTMFITLETEPHDKMKAKVASAYSGRDTPGLEDGVDEQVENLLSLIRRKYISRPGDLHPFGLGATIGLFALDVISKVSLGEEFGCLKEDIDVHSFYPILRDRIPIISVSINVPWIRNIVYSPTYLRLAGPKDTDSAGMGKLMGVTNQIVRERLEPGAKGTKDMLGSFIRHGLTRTECETEALFMFFAGSDTTASVIRITLLNIIATPRVYQRLKDEITTAVRDGKASSPIKNSEAKMLPYLQGVIYEGLRTRPVALNVLPKCVPPGGETINGVFIPAGTSIGMNLSSLLRSPVLFGEDADIFRPERFLELDETARAEMQRNVEFTFGYGRWMCAGKPLALMELNKIFFELLRAFDFQFVDPQKPMKSEGYFLWRDTGLDVWVSEADIKG